jgi:uncharacterized protein YkwD
MSSSFGTKRLFTSFFLVILLFGAVAVYLFSFAKTSPGQQPVVVGIAEARVQPGKTPEPTSMLSTAPAIEEAVIIPVSGCSPVENKDFENQVFRLINQERAKKGVPGLVIQNQLASAALAHSTDMACRGFFSHINPEGKTAYDRIRAQGYRYRSAGETIYAGDGAFNSPGQAINTWLSSATHKQAMLNPAYSEVGVGMIYLPGSKFGGYYTVVFAHPEK